MGGNQACALEGVRVVDFTQQLAGPVTTELLGFLGAEIIRIESRARPDVGRAGSKMILQESSYALDSIQLSKKSVTLNLKQPEAVEIAKRLVGISQVVVENFRPGVMDRLGLGYSDLSEIKPDIIMLSMSSHGASGPEMYYGGWAATLGPLSGISQLIGYPDGPPIIIRSRSDASVGVTGAFAVLAALNYWQRTGKGQWIDLSSREALSVSIGEAIMDYTMNRRVQSRTGNRDHFMAPHNCYPCKGEDKWISIAIGTEEEWRALCAAIGDTEWAKQERFQDMFSRWQNQEELDRLIGEWTINYTHYEVMEILQKLGVAAVPSFSNQEMVKDTHLRHREAFVEISNPERGRQVQLSASWKFSAISPKITPIPLLGEHNEYVFGELLNMSKEEISRLAEEKVIY